MMTFDAASADRLGALTDCAARADELIVLDHHASNVGFGSVRLVDPAAAATAVLARELIARLGIELTRDIALDLYAGLVTDTGSFKFSTTARTTTWPPSCSARAWTRRRSAASYSTAHRSGIWACSRRCWAGPRSNGRRPAAWAWSGPRLPAPTARPPALPLDAVEPVIDVLRRTDEAEVAVVLKEADEGAWQVSARSKGLVDVGRACTALGGGGHAQAAGFTAHGSAADAIAALREQLGG